MRYLFFRAAFTFCVTASFALARAFNSDSIDTVADMAFPALHYPGIGVRRMGGEDVVVAHSLIDLRVSDVFILTPGISNWELPNA